MAASWRDEGTLWDSAGPKVNEWFPVNTDTGQWGTPTPTIASDAGVNWAGIPDLIPTRTMAPSPMMGVPGGAPDQAPVSLGQVAGGFAPQMTTPGGMQRVQRLDAMGALSPARSKWQDVLTAIGGASSGAQGIHGAFESRDRRTQQELQNRLTMRRQELQEAQNERAEIRDDFNSLLKLSEIKSKKLRNLYTDRFIADMQARGKVLPPDFVEAFKSSGGEEAKAMVKFYEPLLTDLGLDPTAFAELVDQGGIKEVGEALSLAQKLKKDKTEQARLAALDKIGAGDTLGDASGTTTPATPGAPTTAAAPGTRQPLAAPSKDISDAIDESTRLYPQVRKELVTSIAASESNFDPKATSLKGAQGVMQLMPDTGKEMGVTDPFDVKQNVRGGTRYYAQMLTKYKGNEALALAAYNWGPGNVDNVHGDLSKMPESVQSYVKTTLQRASAGGGVPATTATGQAATTGGTPQEQQALTRLDQAIALKRQQVQSYARIGGEEGNKRADNARSDMNILIQQRNRIEDRLTKAQDVEQEGPRALQKQQLLEEGELRKAREARALVPIDTKTQETLSTNKSVYRSIGKIEQYFREGTDLPPDFVNLVAQDAPGIRAAMEADPKNSTGILAQWETKLKGASKNDPNVNRFLSALGNMRDLIIRERSGGSVTGNELDRAMGAFMGSLPNINQAFSLFVQNLANVKETVVESLVTAGAASRPLAGGKAMYGTLPKEIRDRIDYAERGEDYPKAQMPAASSPTAQTPPIPRKGTLAGPITPSVR